MPNEQEVDVRLARLFLSLLMALAYCLQTRVDLATYIVACQRYAQEPTAEHHRRLNTIVLWAIKHPLQLIYHFMSCDRKLEADSDAAFRREGTEEVEGGYSGRAVKGAVFVRWGTTTLARNAFIHLIGFRVNLSKYREQRLPLKRSHVLMLLLT